MPDPYSALSDFVTGKLPWTELQSIGFTFEVRANEMSVTSSDLSVTFEASVQDVANGILRHSSVDEASKRWAQALLGVTAIDLSALEDDPDGEVLLNAVWDMAIGKELSAEALRAAKRMSDRR
ncbi:MAG: hypothetical protein WCF24_04810 [Acidimicrobiales bacterium]